MSDAGTGDDWLRISREGAAATLWLNRPDKRNAVTFAMWQGIAAECTRLAGDPGVRVLVVRGVGDHFCAGADVADLIEVDAAAYGEANEAAEAALASFPAPTIAAISGACVGGGAEIALACDLRIADTSSTFGITPARLGIVYPGFALERAVRVLGGPVVKRLLFTGDLVDADAALAIGLVDEVHPAGTLDDRLRALVTMLCERSALTQQATKQMVDGIVVGGALDEELERRWVDEAAASGERDEGIAAFLARRPAAFTWRREVAGGGDG